jgi:hypothetical protein
MVSFFFLEKDIMKVVLRQAQDDRIAKMPNPEASGILF